MSAINLLAGTHSASGLKQGHIEPKLTNGSVNASSPLWNTAEETLSLAEDSLIQLSRFLAESDHERNAHASHAPLSDKGTSLVNSSSSEPEALQSRLSSCLKLSDEGIGATGFQSTLTEILEYSVNPHAPGFLDKLYAAPLPPGIVAELILAYLNTNLHVYQVSPVLTLIEKTVTKQLAAMFGLDGPRAGGVSMQGGSASNLTSIVAARNSLYPETKTKGCHANDRHLILFTSAHGHYSIEKAAQALGFGSLAVVSVPTDAHGRMKADELERLIIDAKSQGSTPFYVNATAGTTVLGSFDPFSDIAAVARRHRCWLHIDGAWGGSFIFSKKGDLKKALDGTHLADSIAINPHKMLGIPLTCSFLLTRDLRLFHEAMTLRAGYLFHEPEDNESPTNMHALDDDSRELKDVPVDVPEGEVPLLYDMRDDDREWTVPNDLADMTLQCGRRGDSLKLLMSWQYHGTAGLAQKVENAYDVAVYLNNLVNLSTDLTLVLGPGSKPECLQVCFYYTPSGSFVSGLEDDESGVIKHPTANSKMDLGKQNSHVVSRISQALILRGFMIDFAPALEGQEDRGSFLRVVINISTIRETAARLVDEVIKAGGEVVGQLQAHYQGQS